MVCNKFNVQYHFMAAINESNQGRVVQVVHILHSIPTKTYAHIDKHEHDRDYDTHTPQSSMHECVRSKELYVVWSWYSCCCVITICHDDCKS